MIKLKRYRLFFILLLGLLFIAFMNQAIAIKTVHITGESILDMLLLLPPIFILVGLLDQWVKKETLIRYMGEKSGIYGVLFTLLLATVAAGPLYIAFPIAVLLLKKGASVRYIVFFLGAWSTVKLPVLVYEFTSFGLKFTFIHICFVLLLKEKFQLLTGLPVRELPNIMTVSQKRKRMPPMDVGLQQQAHGMHPQLNMVIVSKYELVEKSPGVFC